MKVRNKRIYSKDQAYLVKLREEYIKYGDAVTSIEPGCLTIHAVRKTTKDRRKKKNERSPKRPRQNS